MNLSAIVCCSRIKDLSCLFKHLLAHCSHLWEVMDRDIDRFGKAMLDCWLRERLNATTSCVQCNLVAEKLKSMQITGIKGKPKKIGSFMAQAHEEELLVIKQVVCADFAKRRWKPLIMCYCCAR